MKHLEIVTATIGGALAEQGIHPQVANGNGAAQHEDASRLNGVRGNNLHKDYKVIRRNGAVAPFDADKITAAVSKAFIAQMGAQSAASQAVRDFIAAATTEVLAKLKARNPMSATFKLKRFKTRWNLR